MAYPAAIELRADSDCKTCDVPSAARRWVRKNYETVSIHDEIYFSAKLGLGGRVCDCNIAAAVERF